MNIDLPDHVVFKIRSSNYCMSCAIKIVLQNNDRVKAICSSDSYDQCEHCRIYLNND